LKRGIRAGVTNDKKNKSLVLMTFQGQENVVRELASEIKSGKKLNRFNT
jgi:hypothetical protein